MALITENVYVDILAVFVSFVAVIIAYFYWSFGYWKRRGIPTPPKASFGDTIKDAYFLMKSQGLKFCGYYIFTVPVLIILDTELAKNILTKDFIHFTDHGGFSDEKVDPLSVHLFNIKGSKWKNLRAKLTPTFTSGKMKMMFQTLLNCSDELITVMDEIVNQKEVVDIKEIVGRFTTDVIGSCAFGIECNSLKNPNAEFRKYGRKIFAPRLITLLRNVLVSVFPKMASAFNIAQNDPGVINFFMNAVKGTVQYREENNVIRKDFMHLLIQLKNNVEIDDEGTFNQLKVADKSGNEPSVGKGITMQELASQAFIFFLGGFETSSTTISFCLYELVFNINIQDKLREEINEVLERHDGKITYNAIMEMTYMSQCINETLRKYPPLPLLIRECTETYKIPDTDLVLNKGAGVVIPTMGIHHDPEYHPDPEKFDPERFSPENKSKLYPYTWLPFGEGPRICIGMRFGVMQTKVALTVLLKNYRFTLNPKTQTPLIMDPKGGTLMAKGGLWLNAEKI